jgi:hypothetical protein
VSKFFIFVYYEILFPDVQNITVHQSHKRLKNCNITLTSRKKYHTYNYKKEGSLWYKNLGGGGGG